MAEKPRTENTLFGFGNCPLCYKLNIMKFGSVKTVSLKHEDYMLKQGIGHGNLDSSCIEARKLTIKKFRVRSGWQVSERRRLLDSCQLSFRKVRIVTKFGYQLKTGQVEVKPFVLSLSKYERLNRPPHSSSS